VPLVRRSLQAMAQRNDCPRQNLAYRPTLYLSGRLLARPPQLVDFHRRATLSATLQSTLTCAQQLNGGVARCDRRLCFTSFD
jgi:hypothetical protein